MIRLPQRVDEGFKDVVVCGPTMFPVMGMEKLPIMMFSISARSPIVAGRDVTFLAPKLSELLDEEPVDDGGGRCTRWRHFPLTS